MKKCILLTILVLARAASFGQKDAAEREIGEAVLPLPDRMRDGASVVLDVPPGKRTVLRKGTNGLICRANTSVHWFNVYCYPKEMDAIWTRLEQLTLEGKSNAEIRDVLNAEVTSGKLKPQVGASLYTMSGDSAESSLPLMAIFLPYATSGSTGLSTERDHYRPWLMWAGTAFAHVMIPGK